MAVSLEQFKGLVDEAYESKLVLPVFQRKYKWQYKDVLRLYDSLIKNYPIGSFLVLKNSSDTRIGVRTFKHAKQNTVPESFARYVLDGQQRITAGVLLFKGEGAKHCFLNVDNLWDLLKERNVDLQSESGIKKFCEEITLDDSYLSSKSAKKIADSSIDRIDEGLLWIKLLASGQDFRTVLARYLRRFKGTEKKLRKQFMENVVEKHFILPHATTVPVSELDKFPLHAITSVFEAVNTSGLKLTAFDITVATLYPHDISLREDVDGFKEDFVVYENMDSTGESFLQTIALMGGETPQKNKLPQTVTHEMYNLHKNNAIESLKIAGEFLNQRFRLGLDGVKNRKLISYDAMFPPLAIALWKLNKRADLDDASKIQIEDGLERWFAAAIFRQRYTEGQPTKQLNDYKDLLAFVEGGQLPNWVNDTTIQKFIDAKYDSAIGRFIRAMINNLNPVDLLNGDPVGGANTQHFIDSQVHHVFPKKFCEDALVDWDKEKDEHKALVDFVTNTIPITSQTNKIWKTYDPANQISNILKNNTPQKLSDYSKLIFFNQKVLDIMQRPNKAVADFRDFLQERSNVINTFITRKWGFKVTDIQDEKEASEEDVEIEE